MISPFGLRPRPAIDAAYRKFDSANSIPVERAWFTRQEVDAIVAEARESEREDCRRALMDGRPA